MADESKQKLLWRLSEVAPGEPFAEKRGINYHARPVDEYAIKRDDMLKLARQYIDCINRHDLDAAMAMCDDQMADRTLPGEPITKEGVRQNYTALMEPFPDLSLSVVNIYVDGDMFVINGELHGTSQGEFYGTPATGKPFDTFMLEIFKVRGTKFVERHFWFDAMKIVRAITAP
jgi:predicted ester cyclase